MMARCIHCGRSAGLFRHVHAECEQRHERAMSLIPGFFPKFFESGLPIDRFQELLKGAAESSFVKPTELESLTRLGIQKVIDVVREQRLPDHGDMQRLSEVIKMFSSILSDDVVPHEIIVKINVLMELRDSKIPDLVSVTGPMPIKLRQGETVIWIFNHVKAHRPPHAPDPDTTISGVDLPLDEIVYYNPSSFKDAPTSRDGLGNELPGDLVVTSRNVYLLTRGARPTRIPVARIRSLRAYADGIHIASEPAEERTLTLLLDDPWFAGNMLVRLVQLVRR